jgi:hypothetical protein
LWVYAATGLFCDCSAQYLKTNNHSYHWLGNIFLLLEFLFISFFYRDYIFKRKLFFQIIILTIPLIFILNTWVDSVTILNQFGAGVSLIIRFNTFAGGILCILYIAYGLLGFYHLLQNPDFTFLEKSPFFIVNVAFFLYASANCLLLLFASYLSKVNLEFLVNTWGNFFTTINILRYLLIGIALYKTKQTWISPA